MKPRGLANIFMTSVRTGLLVFALMSVCLNSSLSQSGNAAAPTDVSNSQSSLLSLSGHIGGRTDNVVVQGDYAFVKHGPEAAIVDISDPAHPARIGYIMLPERLTDLAVQGNYLFTSWAHLTHGRFDYTGALNIFDVSDPAHPVEIGSYIPSGGIWDIAISGNYIYLSKFNCVPNDPNDCDGGIEMVDITDPTHPFWVDGGGYLGSPRDMAAANGFLYMTTNRWLLIFDISDPANPLQLLSSDMNQGWLYSIAISGNYAYAADISDGLVVIDVTNPYDPQEISHQNVGGYANDAAVQGSYVYVTEEKRWDSDLGIFVGGGMRVVDVSNPLDPVEISYYPTPSAAMEIVARDNLVYVCDESSGLHIVDISNPAQPEYAGLYGVKGKVFDIGVMGDYVYGVSFVWDIPGVSGLWAVDASDKANPVEIGFYGMPGASFRVEAAENYAYTYQGNDGSVWLKVMDVSQPMTPTQFSVYTDTMSAADFIVQNDFAYAAKGYSGFEILDIHNPYSITIVSQFDANNAREVAIQENYAYIGDGYDGLWIVDITDPAHPIQAGYSPGDAFTVEVMGNFAYVTGETGMTVLDISDPANILPITGLTMPGMPTTSASLKIGDLRYVFLTCDWGGLRVIDVTNPTQPFEADFYDLPATARDMVVIEPFVYVADDDGGLYIFRFEMFKQYLPFAAR